MQYDIIINFQKEGLFEGQKCFRMEIKSLEPGLVCKQAVAKEGGPKVHVFERCVKLRRRVNKLMKLKRITDGSLGTGPPVAGGYG